MTISLQTVTDLPDRLLSRLGPWPFSLVAGLLVTLVATLVAAPARMPESLMGILNVQLAADPFGTSPNAMAPRFLTPLLAWLLGLRGEGLLVLIAFCCVLLPAVAARWALRCGSGAYDALLTAGVPGLTLLTRTSLHHGGLTDVVTYLLIFGAWVGRARPGAAIGCFLLALLNHERALFLLPWLGWLLWREAGPAPGRRRVILLGIPLAVAIWLLAHQAILSHREVEHSLGYYLQPLLADPLVNLRLAWPWQPLGFLSAFQWLWLLPLWHARWLWREGNRADLLGLALLLVGVGGQFLFAYDSSRLAALAFPCLLPAVAAGLREGGAPFRRRLALVLLLQAITPQVFTAGHLVEILPGWLSG